MQSLLHVLSRAAQVITEKHNKSVAQLADHTSELTEEKSVVLFLERSSSRIKDKITKDISSLREHFQAWQPPASSSKNNQLNSDENCRVDRSKMSSKLTGKQSRLVEIEAEKHSILKQIKFLDDKINEIKGEQNSFNLSRKRESLQKEEEANEAAKKLVNRYKQEKRQKEEKKRLQTQRLLKVLKDSEQQFRKQLSEQQNRQKGNKRREIQLRLQDCRKKRQERLQMDRESNKLVVELLKQKQLLMQRSALPEEIVQLQQKKMSMCEKKQDIDFKEIQEHERKYIAHKHREEEIKHQRGISVGHPTQKYSKNMWASILEAQERKKREQMKVKETQPKEILERRVKYGQLVKSIFANKQQERPRMSREATAKPKTPDVHYTSNDNLTLPKISESQKRINETKLMKKYRENNRIETSPGNSKQRKQSRKDYSKSPEELEEERKRAARMHELKRQTDERLRKIDTQVHHIGTPEKSEKPRYKNYLGTVKLRKKERPKQWRKIIENSSLTEEQRCLKMLKHAEELELQAKKRQQIRTESVEQESIQLYINSIQAKLALLQKF